MVSTNRLLLRLLAALSIGAAFALPAAAKTYCCTDKSGHKICADTLPEQCEERAYKEFGDKGKVRNVDAPLTAEQKAQRAAAEARKKEEERIAGEQRRKDLALLNTYGSEKDIDFLRDRAVADMEATGKQAQDKYAAALKRKQQLAKELEFYAKKPIPDSLKSQIKENEIEIQAQKKALDDKNKDIEAVRAKFEEDRMRYRALMQGGGKSAASPAARPH
ncbi:MAG: hypothetical protein A2045_15715 [Rhodocyclales bacterium GWA2_65_20]|nr:MAG: hypothetical protein A2045_15715 [Rhodocyclales bacterium GWA2_65_20]